MMSARRGAAIHRIVAEVRLVLEWWHHELRDAWHSGVTRLVPRRADRVWISINAGEGHVRWVLNGKADDGMRFPVSEPYLTPQELAAHLPEIRPSTRTRVQLDLSYVLLRDIVLPAAAERDLPGVVALQVERMLPLPPDALYIDWRLKKRLPDLQRIVVTIAAAKRHEIDNLRDSIEQTGLRVDDISASGANGAQSFNFSRLKFPLQTRGLGKQDRVLTATLAVMLLGWCGLMLGQTVYERSRIGAIVKDERTRAEPARLLEQRIRAWSVPMDRLQNLAQTPTAVDLVAALTEAIPADTWVYSAEISGGSAGTPPAVKMSGFTPTATMLVDLLSRSPALQSVKLVKAAGTSGGIGIDRFEITAQLSKRAGAASTSGRGSP